MEIPRNRDITYFAKTNYRDNESMFGIKRRDRRQHMYVLGKSGTGKSALMKNMVIQNIANGEGVAVVDPHGELVEEILEMIPPERKEDVVYFNPADTEYFMGFNVLEVPDPKYKHLIASGLMGIFTKIWANVWSSRMEYILNNAILALLDTPGSTMLGIPRLLVDQDYRQAVLENVTDPIVRSFWITEYEAWQERFRNEAIAPIQNKVGQFLSSSVTRNIVGQSKSSINIFDIMNNKKILLVNVSKGRVGEDNSALLGAMLITKIQLGAMERVRIPEEERKDFYLYVDEFQNFVTDSFASILSEARKYRLNLVLAHQYIAQLVTNDSTMVRDAVFGNVGTMAVFRVGAADAEFLEKEFEPEFTPQDFVNQPNYHVYLKLMIDGVTSRPFSASTLPPFKVSGSHATALDIIEHSRRLYAQPREEVEAEIDAWSRSKPGNEDVPEAGEADDKELKPGNDGRYRVKCSLFEDCGNIAEVPFKPEKGRPVYCKEHIEKIKSGEAQPIKMEPRKPNKRVQESISALASIGIGFNPEEGQKGSSLHHKKKNDKTAPPKTRRVHIGSSSKKKEGGDSPRGSLKDILSEALGKKPETKKEEVQATKSEAETEKEHLPQKTLSLSDLKTDSKESTKHSSETKKLDRAASDNSLSSLKEVLAKASSADEKAKKETKVFTPKPRPVDQQSKPAEPTIDPKVAEAQKKELEEQKKLLEKAQAEAQKKAEEAKQKVLEEQKKREEAEKTTKEHADKLVAEAEARKQAEAERDRLAQEKDAADKKASTKEVPEDVLQSVLE